MARKSCLETSNLIDLLQKENANLKERIEKLTHAKSLLRSFIDQIADENKRLRIEHEDLRAALRNKNPHWENQVREKDEMREFITDLLNTNAKLRQEIEQLEKEKQQLEEKLKHESQPAGRMCSRDCVLCVVVWICRNKLGEQNPNVCGRLLEHIIILRNANIITEEYVQCENLMQILIKCKIVNILVARDDKTGILKKIDMVWNTLMERPKDEMVCILGTHPLHGRLGHAEVFDLESRSEDRKTIKKHDPQNNNNETMDQECFKITYNNNADLALYNVNFEELKKFTSHHSQPVAQGISLLSLNGPSNQP